MIVSAAGLNRIASADRFRAIGALIRGVAVIGFSHTRTAAVGNGITRIEALALLRDDLDRLAPLVEAVLPRLVSQKVFDLLAFYAWRNGVSGLTQSLVFKQLVAGQTAPSAAAYAQSPRASDGTPVPPPPGKPGGGVVISNTEI